MMETVELRRALAAFLGGDRFRKFVRQGFRKGRLRAWQEQEWNRFTAAHPEFAVGWEELAVALRIGPLPGEGREKDSRSTTIAAGVVGAIIAGTVHLAVVYVCCLLYYRHDPSSGERFPDATGILYSCFALCATPLSMLYGAAIGVRCAQPRKPASPVTHQRLLSRARSEMGQEVWP
jgi:hypothetical protein